jgi:heme exporter protein CcmD
MSVDHLGFIVAAYALAVAAIAAMIGGVLLEHRRLRRDLSRFDARREDGA